MSTSLHESCAARLAAGERLTRDELEQLAATPDILSVGMLADEVRRRVHGTRVTFLRVASCAFDKPFTDAVALAAREVRLTGVPPSLDVAVSAVQSGKAVAGGRAVSGFSLADLQALADAAGQPLKSVLQELRAAGLDAPAEIPIDKIAAPEATLDALVASGYVSVRLTVAKPAAADRIACVWRAAALAEQFSIVTALSPLPMSLAAFRPTTGYEDVKAIALARLAAPPPLHIQVDWQRYGPKLAQVALTFGADDVDNVAASDEAPDGRRRAPLEEVRRNIEAAGFEAAERDGRWQ